MFDKIHLHFSFILCRNFSARRAFEFVFHKSIGASGDVDFSCLAVLFHSRSHVYGITPDVVRKFFKSYHTSYNRASVNTNTEFKCGKVLDCFCDGKTFDEGFVGVSLSGEIEVETVVSQGCRPIGRPLVITKAHENIVEQLGGKPALVALREIVDELDAEQRELLQHGLLIGRAISEYRERFGRGDFLVRNIIGVDQEKGALALADFARVGQTVQFHVRDAATASEDLTLMLEVQKVDDPPAGALLFSCNGRGTRMFSALNHDITVARRAMPATPVAGFFAAGEIGPVGGENFIHGHTASFALFRSKTS